MTIIQPNKNKNKLNLIVSLLLFAIVALISQGIYFYSQSVNFRHDITRLEKDIRDIEVSNADMKNKLFALFDPNNTKIIIESGGLIEEKNPQYIKNSDNPLAKR